MTLFISQVYKLTEYACEKCGRAFYVEQQFAAQEKLICRQPGCDGVAYANVDFEGMKKNEI